VPVDAVGGVPPAGLAVLTGGARSAFAAAGAGRWEPVASRAEAMSAAWAALKQAGGSGAPELLASQMTGALDALARAVDARDPARTRQAALRVEQAALDLELRHRPPAEVDLDRLDLWARQLRVDAAAGDVATLQIIWDRAGHTATPAAAERVSAGLAALGKAVEGEDLRAAAAAVPALRDAVAAAQP
jgi:hypothetical protein